MYWQMDGKQEVGEDGYALLAAIILMALGLTVIFGSLDISSTNSRTVKATKVRSERYYSSETGVNQAVNWLRENSESIVTPFLRENFYNTFDRTAPSVGDNEGGLFSVATQLKLQGTNNSIILASDVSLASPMFPYTEHLTSAMPFSASTEFASAGLSEAIIRITLVDAIAENPAADFGPPPNPEPETEFIPVYRVDAMTSANSGAHVYGFVLGDNVSSIPSGFYGETFVNIEQDCDSYDSEDGAYNVATNRNPNCPVGSRGPVRVKSNAEVYGTVTTTAILEDNPPWAGAVCANFTDPCPPNTGTICEGVDCEPGNLPTIDPWLTLCPANQGDQPVNSNFTLPIASDDAADRCWETVTVKANTTLTLSNTTTPYYIRTLLLRNNSNSILNIAPDTPGETVTLFVETIVGDSINGNQAFNLMNRPGQFVINYVGGNDLLFNGNADIKARVVATNAGVTVSGNFDFFGGIQAITLTFSGNARPHYDESMDNIQITDSAYQLRQLVQRYR